MVVRLVGKVIKRGVVRVHAASENVTTTGVRGAAFCMLVQRKHNVQTNNAGIPRGGSKDGGHDGEEQNREVVLAVHAHSEEGHLAQALGQTDNPCTVPGTTSAGFSCHR